MPSQLRADVFVSSALRIAGAPDGDYGRWSPISCTLIQGDSEAVLVDTPISEEQTKELIEWIEQTAPSKKLAYIYITHGHGDHFFGLSQLKERWPDAKAIATAGSVAHAKDQVEGYWWDEVWNKCFPGQIHVPVHLPETLLSDSFTVEGHTFRVVEVGHTDTKNTTVLHVPAIGLIVAGDVVFGDVHLYFGEASTTELRNEWIKALDAIESLNPQTVVAGHKKPGAIDGVFNIQLTREYIESYEKIVNESSSKDEVRSKLLKRYPSRFKPLVFII
ncbi:beta-lactamase-like protein [Xylogone sp. PMI_703]|nr:beta-lactamase-like protein [Xylogone sp. PMI_703]